MTQKKPDILNLAVSAESQLFRVEQVDLRFSNGEARTYERIAGKLAGGAVMIVPLLNDTTLLLIREYCVGVDAYVLGFPKGFFNMVTGRQLRHHTAPLAMRLGLAKDVVR